MTRKYDLLCACPKCGRGPRTHKVLQPWYLKFVETHYREESNWVPMEPHAETYHDGSWTACWRDGCPGRKLWHRKRGDHFYRRCDACKTGWIEATLDAEE